MPGNSTHANNNTGMLHHIVRIKQFCSYDSNFFTLNICKHFTQPVFPDYFYIIIQKQKVLSIRIPYSKIIYCRIIKLVLPYYNPNIFTLLYCFIIFKYFICCTIILYNNNLVIFVICFLYNRLYATLQYFFLVFIRYNN